MVVEWLSGIRKVWKGLDRFLEGIFGLLRTILRVSRALRVVAALLILVLLVLALLPFFLPASLPFLVAAIFVVSIVPWIILFVLAGLPLRQKSLVRLVKKGYPESSREIAIRVAARKLRDESIQTEELLFETAINEGRKAVKKYEERAKKLQQRLEALERSEESEPVEPAPKPAPKPRAKPKASAAKAPAKLKPRKSPKS